MTLQLTYGDQPWTVHGWLYEDGLVRRLIRPGGRPSARHTPGREAAGYVLHGFTFDDAGGLSQQVDVPAYEMYLYGADLVNQYELLFPVLGRRQDDKRRHQTPLWAWTSPLLAVLGTVPAGDVMTARRLHLMRYGVV